MYWLAEGEEPRLHSFSDFNASYAWELHHLMNSIARGEKNIPELLEYVAKDAANNPADAFRLMFTSNHDENSWAGTEFERNLTCHVTAESVDAALHPETEGSLHSLPYLLVLIIEVSRI